MTYVHGESAVTIDPGATVPADADGDYLASATVSIASGLGTGDTLNFTNQNGITGSFSSGTLTLTGVATEANYQTALDSVTFSTTSAERDAPHHRLDRQRRRRHRRPRPARWTCTSRRR